MAKAVILIHTSVKLVTEAAPEEVVLKEILIHTSVKLVTTACDTTSRPSVF